MVHGVGLNGMMFLPIADELAASFHSYAIDLRGQGQSGVPPNLDFDWARLGDDVGAGVELVKSMLESDSLIAIAHSAGGAAALLAEARRPGSFEAMYCYEPIVRSPQMREKVTAHHPMVAQALRRKAIFASRDEAYERFSVRAPFSTLDERALRAYVEYGLRDLADGTVQLCCLPEYEAALYLSGVDAELWDLADAITCPVTVAFGGANGNELGRSFAQSAADRLSNAQLVEFKELGHFGPFEDPSTVAKSIIEAFDIGTA